MTTKHWLLAGTALAVTLAMAAPAQAAATKAKPAAAPAADPTKAELDLLKQQIQMLQQRLSDMEIGMGAQLGEVKKKQDEGAQLEFENGRPVFKSADGRFEMAMRGRFHFDAASFNQNSNLSPAITGPQRDLSSGATFRRSQFGVEGKVFRDWEYEFRYEFGGSGTEGSGGINIMRLGYTGIPNTRIDLGAIQPLFTLDDSTSSNDITFMERAAIANVMVGNYGGSDSRRGLAATWRNDNFLIQGAYTGGQISSVRTNDEQTQVLGRMAYRMAPDADSNIQIGVSGAVLTGVPGQAPVLAAPATLAAINIQERPNVRVDGNRLVATGNLSYKGGSAYGMELAGNYKNFYLQGEYYDFGVDRTYLPTTAANLQAADPRFNGWYVQGSWIITGETKRWDNKSFSFGAPRPNSPFTLGGTWGAWELAARYDVLNLNKNAGAVNVPVTAVQLANAYRGGEQSITTLGVNWYVNRNIRFMLNQMFVSVDKIESAAASRSQSQDLNITAIRAQFAF